MSNDYTSEKWRPIKGFPQYAVSNLGRLKSLGRTETYVRKNDGATVTRVRKEKVLKLSRNGRYLTATIYAEDGEKQQDYVHRFVAEAFLRRRVGCDLVMHRDDNGHNNASKNLRWGTHADNMQDMVTKGRSRTGEKNHRAVLTEKEAKKIIKLLDRCYTTTEIMEVVDCTKHQVSMIRRGRAWRHLTGVK